MKRKKGSKPTVSYLTRSLKRVGKSVGRRKPASIARQVMCHPRIKKQVIGEVGRLMQEEMKEMCKTKTSSLLRGMRVQDMSSFTFEGLADELRKNAPTFTQLMFDCVTRKRRIRVNQKRKSFIAKDATIVGICASIILRHRNRHMNLFQRIVSVLLYSNNVPEQVNVIYDFVFLKTYGMH